MFIVKENNIPCRFPDHKVDPSWNNCEFKTFEEAVDYALNWLGCYAPERGRIKAGVPYEYESECFILIEEVP